MPLDLFIDLIIVAISFLEFCQEYCNFALNIYVSSICLSIYYCYCLDFFRVLYNTL